ncbi:uracil-DNA glycosylase [Candidatus Protochlamydia phocaeensis]|uniref:uracil-DNA glycosylase n=1 Tax=Candidatus Protochlamydia phocaeensis TaxID=1414722 RepID=UPI000837B109|nr:uracil-DNA glycosylase [Candidatus Protochlamydia phocaeensis]
MAKHTFTPFVLEPSWQKVMKEELSQPYVAELAAFVEKEYASSPKPIYPPRDLIFNAFQQTPFHKTQVLLMGQDPYHGPGQAHGLSFSVPKGVKPPPSLQNIFKELESDVHIPRPSNGCLIPWAKQGILLLNATLTVRQGEPLSHHGRGWEHFTDAVVRKLQEREDPVIFVLWGKSAQDKCRFLRESGMPSRHFILTAAHPSPYSANNGFFGCRHFSKINELLEQQGKTPIFWPLED